MQVPVITSGVLPAISFSPQFLAEALVIGSTLRLSDGLSDGLSPALVTNPSGATACSCRAVESPKRSQRMPQAMRRFRPWRLDCEMVEAMPPLPSVPVRIGARATGGRKIGSFLPH